MLFLAVLRIPSSLQHSCHFRNTATCTGYLGYPFENKRVKSNMEKLAPYVAKEEKIWVKLIVSAHVLERISQVAVTVGMILRQARISYNAYL